MIVPVIHCLNWSQINSNLEICKRNGIEMVFLINHRPSEEAIHDLSLWVNLAKSNFPEIKIGVNFLQLDTPQAIQKAQNIQADAIWSDYPGTSQRSIPYFGAVAFKYQKHVPSDQLESVCHEAMKMMDVITTSGPGTGQPASIEKIKSIRSYIGDFPLAIASGVNKDNKKIFEPLVDYMLVASSITDSNEMIDEIKLQELLNS